MPFEGVYGVNIAMLAGFLSFYALAEMVPEESKFGPEMRRTWFYGASRRIWRIYRIDRLSSCSVTEPGDGVSMFLYSIDELSFPFGGVWSKKLIPTVL